MQNTWLSRSWQQRHKQEVGYISAKLSVTISIAHWLNKTSLCLCAVYSAWCTCLKWLSYLNYYLAFHSCTAEICIILFFASSFSYSYILRLPVYSLSKQNVLIIWQISEAWIVNLPRLHSEPPLFYPQCQKSQTLVKKKTKNKHFGAFSNKNTI